MDASPPIQMFSSLEQRQFTETFALVSIEINLSFLDIFKSSLYFFFLRKKGLVIEFLCSNNNKSCLVNQVMVVLLSVMKWQT